MSSKPRIVAPGVFYHISSEGVKDLQMFKNNQLRIFLLEQLAKTLKKYNFICHAFSITINQYDLILQSNQQSISHAMQHFNSLLAKMVNKVMERNGTVFATRFRSVIVEKDLIRDLIRSVHLQPVIQGECCFNDLDHYQWSSHSVILGNCDSKIINKEDILKLLNIESIKDYQQFMKNPNTDDQLGSTLKNVKSGKQGFRKPQLYIIGKPEFVKQVLELDRCRRLQIARHISEKVDIKKVHQEVARLLTIDEKDLYRAGQQNIRSTARELFASICKLRYDFSAAETGRYLQVTDSAVSRMISRFDKVNNGEYLTQHIIAEIFNNSICELNITCE